MKIWNRKCTCVCVRDSDGISKDTWERVRFSGWVKFACFFLDKECS